MKAVEREFRISTSLMLEIKPSMTLVGSAAEGTRIGIGNELDITVMFVLWKDKPALKVGENPFYLIATENVSELMRSYFDEN